LIYKVVPVVPTKLGFVTLLLELEHEVWNAVSYCFYYIFIFII